MAKAPWVPAALLLGLLGATGQAAPSSASRVAELRLEHRGSAGLPFAVVARPIEECSDITAREARLEGTEVLFDASICSRWRVGCRGADVFCPEIVWPPEVSDQQSTTLAVYPAADLTVRLQRSGRVMPPDSVRIQGFVRSQDGQNSTFFIEVAVQDDEVHTPVPASVLDLRIAAGGFAPSYHWSVNTQSGNARLKAELRSGGSISGFVVSAGNESPVAGAEVRILPRGFDLVAPETVERFSTLTASTTTTGERGFFQVIGLQPEVYTVHAQAAGYSSATVEAVQIQEDAESRLASPLVLAPAVSFVVTIDPPAFPPDQRWGVELVARARPGIRRHRFEQIADEAGIAEFSSLPPGEYDLVLWAGEDRTRHYAERVNIAGNDVAQIELQLVEVQGTITLGDEPLVAEIELSTGNRDDWAFNSDDEGKFAGAIRAPEQGTLLARVKADEDIETQIILKKGSGLRFDGEILRIEIEIPDGSISGLVVDQRGQPVAGAEILAGRNPLRLGETASDRFGDFSLRGLPYEIIEVAANHPLHGTAGPQVVDLSAGLDPAPLRLVLELSVTLSGHLRWADRSPVRAVPIYAFSLGRGFRPDTAQTLLDGSFELRGPPDADRALLKVMSRGALVWSQCVPISEERIDVTLPFSVADGRLDLEIRNDPKNPLLPSGGAWAVVSREGGLLELGDFGAVWDRFDRDPEGQWTRIGVSGIAPGTYAAIWLPLRLEDRIRMVCTHQISDAWEWRTLDPGGTVSFVLDSSQD